MSFLFGRKAAPPPATNGLPNLPTANKALTNALHTVANVKLRNALKAAKNVANASALTKNARIKELEAAINAARPVVNAAAAVAPTIPVEPATQNAEAAVVNALIRNISKYNTRENLNKVKNNQRYKNAPNNANRGRINQAVNNRRLELITPIV
jgi:hypothetical protein